MVRKFELVDSCLRVWLGCGVESFLGFVLWWEYFFLHWTLTKGPWLSWQKNLETIDRLLYEGHMRLKKLAHPEPYIGTSTPIFHYCVDGFDGPAF